jgi:phosphatidylglycerophosphate synthase
MGMLRLREAYAPVLVGAPLALPEASDARLNLPNAVTLGGYAATIGWLGGGPGWLAVAGLVADEADGRIARATGQESRFGSLLDWAVDLSLTALVLWKLGWAWALVAVLPVQVYFRDSGWRPAIGSARAAFTIAALVKGA